MTRLSIAIALVINLSGLSAAAAAFCTQPGMTVTSCCCQHESGEPRADRALEASAPCPCTMAPRPAAPAAPLPATQLSANHAAAAVLTPLAAVVSSLDARLIGRHTPTSGDPGPSYLTAAPPRC